MRCPYCAFDFDEKKAEKECEGCYSFSGCSMLKCPKCGYEIPPEPKWIGWLRSRFNKGNKK